MMMTMAAVRNHDYDVKMNFLFSIAPFLSLAVAVKSFPKKISIV